MLLAISLMASSISSAPKQNINKPIDHSLFSVLDLRSLKSGDLVFREGLGWRAQAVKTASGNTLTHVGILDRMSNGDLVVIHADPPEGDLPGMVRIVPLARFAADSGTTGVRFVHLGLAPNIRRSEIKFARNAANHNVPFDDDFDFSSDNALYCTELVWKSLRSAGVKLPIETTPINLPLLRKRYMTPDNLLNITKPFQKQFIPPLHVQERSTDEVELN